MWDADARYCETVDQRHFNLVAVLALVYLLKLYDSISPNTCPLTESKQTPVPTTHTQTRFHQSIIRSINQSNPIGQARQKATMPQSMTTARDIPIIITSTATSPSERRITPSWTIAHLKTKLEPVTGIAPSSQILTLRLPDRQQQETPIDAEDEESVEIGTWPLVPYAEIKVNWVSSFIMMCLVTTHTHTHTHTHTQSKPITFVCLYPSLALERYAD